MSDPVTYALDGRIATLRIDDGKERRELRSGGAPQRSRRPRLRSRIGEARHGRRVLRLHPADDPPPVEVQSATDPPPSP